MPLRRLIDSGQAITPPPDVQNTTFSIDAVGRFACNTWDEAAAAGGAPLDAIVIGAGMYGAYCAERLFRSGGKVLLLEAGPFLVTEHVQNLARLGLDVPAAILPESPDAQRARALVWGIPWRGNQIFPGLAFCVGGKSLYWGGWSPRLTADVLAKWPAAARNALNTFYPLAERQTGASERTDFIEDAPLLAVLQTKIDAAVPGIAGLQKSAAAPVAVQGSAPTGGSGLFSFDKYSSCPLLTDAVREDCFAANGNDAQRRLLLVPKTRVLKLFASGGVVNSLLAFSDGVTRSLAVAPSTTLVLALSAIESTRLALESFPTPLMGRNLMVHMRSNTAVRIPRSVFSTLPHTPLQTAALHIPGSAPSGARFHLQMVAAADPNSNAEAVWFRMIPSTEELEKILANEDADKVVISLRGCAEMIGVRDRGSPDPTSSWIDLSPFEIDEFGYRRAYVHLTTAAADNAAWDAMDDATIALAKALADNDPTKIEYLYGGGWHHDPPPSGKLTYEGGVRDPLGTTYHESGTLWMGDDPATSVTDAAGRFHHISNAFCIDQAIFPFIGSANPALTGLALTRHAVEVILGH